MNPAWKLWTPLVLGVSFTLGFIFALWKLDQTHNYSAVRFYMQVTPESGLLVGHTVWMQGREAGMVESIDGAMAKLAMKRDAAIRLSIDSQVMVVPSGLLGDHRVQIVPGTGTIAPPGHRFVETPLPPEDDELNRLIKKAITKSLKEFVGEE